MKTVLFKTHSLGKTRNTRNFSSSKNTVNQYYQKSPLPTFPKSLYACYSCGSPDHSRAQCKYRNVICSQCKRPGHIAHVCKKGNMQNSSVEQKLDSDEVFLEEELYTLFDVNSLFTSEISVPVVIENEESFMQLDTGCALSLAPKNFYDQFLSHIPLKPTAVKLSTYTGEKIQPLGQATVKVSYAGIQHSLPLLVVPHGSGPLFGRNWLRHVKLDWDKLPGVESRGPNSNTVRCSEISNDKKTLDSLLSQYDQLFEPHLGCYTGEPVVLNASTGAKFHKARPVPYALQNRVEKALLKMETDGVIERVTCSPYCYSRQERW